MTVSVYQGETELLLHNGGKEESVYSREQPLGWVSFSITMYYE